MTTISGNATGVGRLATLSVADRGEDITIALSGTYNMSIRLEREVGATGSGAWETVAGPWTTADATVSEIYTTVRFDERLALNVYVDTSGTVAYSYGDGDKIIQRIRDQVGNILRTIRQSGETFANAVTVSGAFTASGAATIAGTLAHAGVKTGPAPVVSTDPTSLALTAALHAGKTVYLTDLDGAAVTLPAATGTGNKYKVVLAATITSSSTTIKVANSSDSFVGMAFGVDTDVEGATGYQWNADAADDTVTMEGVARGGVKGDTWEFEDLATNVWAVRGYITQSGASEVTPFSASV